MPYAVVRDVPASWEHYPLLAAAIADPVPAELILHLAGPTDEGFRTIEVWETCEAWQRWCDDRPADAFAKSLSAPATLREFDALATLGVLAEPTGQRR
jgi:hypothetical protein